MIPIGTRFASWEVTGPVAEARPRVELRCANCGIVGRAEESTLRSGKRRDCKCVEICRLWIGLRFGSVVVTGLAGRRRQSNGHSQLRWSLRCDCGGTHEASTTSLQHGRVRSCGCKLTGYPMEDISGREFGFWTVIRFSDRCWYKKGPAATGGPMSRWLCECVCGKRKSVFRMTLISGDSHSCGCQAPRGVPAEFK